MKRSGPFRHRFFRVSINQKPGYQAQDQGQTQDDRNHRDHALLKAHGVPPLLFAHCPRPLYIFKNLPMAMVEPPAPMAKPAPRNTTRIISAMSEKGTVLMISKIPLFSMEFWIRR